MDLDEIGRRNADWIHVAQNVNTEVCLWVF
jgi:hypothetical protein